MPDLNRLEDGKRPDQRLTIADRVVSYFKGPVEKLVRMKARELEHQFSFGYNDFPERRQPSGGLYGQAAAETWRSNRDRLKAMWDARDLCKFEFIGGMMARIVLYVCGKFHSRSLTGEEQIDQAYDDYWKGWCGDQPNEDGTIRCDITGRHRFGKLVQMGFLGHLIDGDCGFIEVDPQLSPTGEFCIQPVESDRIGSPLDQQVQENYIGGINLDPISGRIGSFRIYRRTRTNQYLDPQDVPAAAFIHLHDADRFDEYRGRTKLLRLLNDARDIREWVEFEKMAGKTQSQWAAMVGLRDPYTKEGAMAWSGKTEAGTPTQPAEYGKILRMAEGEVFNMLAPPSRPSGAFMEFAQLIIRKMGVSLDLPYEFLWDLSGLGGVTARISVQQTLRRIEGWQEFLKIKVLNRVRQKVIAQGIAMQLLPPHPLWTKVEWHFGQSIETDVGYQMDADIAATQHGIAKISDITAKYGKSPREVFLSNAQTANEAISVGAETGLPVEAFAAGLFPALTEQRAAFVSGPIPPPPPGSIEALGDKGVKQLIDVLTAVGEGKMDRDAAKQTLMRTFGVPPAIAEKMVPDEPDNKKLMAMKGGPKPNGSKPTPARNQRVTRPKASTRK